MDNNLSVFGNNGGDYIKIKEFSEGTVSLEVGHCCVKIISAVVPVEFLTALISEACLEHSKSLNSVETAKNIIDTFKWSEDFKTQLKDKVGTITYG